MHFFPQNCILPQSSNVLVSNSTSSFQAAFCYFFCPLPPPVASGILVPRTGMEPMPPELESLCH